MIASLNVFAAIEVPLTGLTKFKDAVQVVKNMFEKNSAVNVYLRKVDVTLPSGHSSGIGVYFSDDKVSNKKQFAWIPIQMVSTVQAIFTAKNLEHFKEAKMVSFKEREISEQFTRTDIIIRVICPIN